MAEGLGDILAIPEETVVEATVIEQEPETKSSEEGSSEVLPSLSKTGT